MISAAMVMPHKKMHERTEKEDEKRPSLCNGWPLEHKSQSNNADDEADDAHHHEERHIGGHNEPRPDPREYTTGE